MGDVLKKQVALARTPGISVSQRACIAVTAASALGTRALVVRTVDWRGNRLRVTTGSRLHPAAGTSELEATS